MIDQALIFAAGFAKRMRPLTDHLPKPLVTIGDKALLTHIIDHLNAVGVTKIVVNGHHKIDVLRDYMTKIQSDYPHITFILSEEDEILETGGGAIKAMVHFDQTKPLYMVNGDAFWVDAQHEKTLEVLESRLLTSQDDMVLLLQSTDQKDGDYTIINNRAVRTKTKDGTHMFAGVRALHPRILDTYSIENFSFLKIMDDVEAYDRLGGLDHQGQWYHISTPKDLDDANAVLFPQAINHG